MQEKALEHAVELFEEGDTDKNGTLSCNEIVVLMRNVSPSLLNANFKKHLAYKLYT